MPIARQFTRFAFCALAVAAAVTTLAGSAEAQLKVIPLLGEDTASGKPAKRPAVSVTLTPADQPAVGAPKPGDEVVLAVKLEVPPGSHTYSMSPTFLGRTIIEINETRGLTPVDEAFSPDHPPKRAYDTVFEQEIEKFTRTVTWSRKFRISAVTEPDSESPAPSSESPAPQQVSISGKFRGQVCDNRTCRPISESFQVALVEATVTVRPYKDAVIPARKAGKPEPITFTFELAPEDARAGDEVTLSITAKPAGEFHIFALSQDSAMAGLPTTLTLAEHPGLEPVDDAFRPSKQYEIEKPLPDIMQRVHYGEVTWSRRFKLAELKSPGGYGVSGSVRYQICREGTCRLPMTVPFALGRVETPATAVTPTGPETSKPEPRTAGLEQTVTTETAADSAKKGGLLPFLITAVLAGFVALLTPCVFPMIPITVSFFLKQSEKEHHRPVSMALVYCAGIIVTFTGLGLLMSVLFKATAMQQLANHPWLNLGIAGVLVFFGLNLLGLFELRLPSGLLTWSSGQQGHGGIIGVLFMALTFTLVSFTCTFAFAGGLLVLAARGEYFWPILGMLAFSAAFSLPFFFLALFPSYLQKLPKSGGWMTRVKVTMGIIECAAALKFLNIADQMWNPVPLIFDYPIVMSLWVVLALATGLYLLGAFRLPHDSSGERLSKARLTSAVAFFALAGYLAVGLFAPQKMWDQIAAFAPPRFEGGKGDIGPYLEHDGLAYALSFEDARQFARRNNQPMFLDFTGVNCVNCRLMEDRMKQPENRRELEKFVRVQLYTDNVPHLKNRQLAAQLKENNLRLQEDWFGDVTLPSYAVVSPDGKTLLATYFGLEQQEGEFAQFLSDGFAKWQRLAAAEGKTKTAEAVRPASETAVQ